VASLCVDPLIAGYSSPQIPKEEALRMAILCAVATIPFLKQDAVCRVVAKLRTHNKKLLESPSTWTTGMIVGGIALMASVKALLIPRLDNVIAIIFLLCVIFGVLKALRQAVKETKAVRDTHRDNPKMQIDQWQMQLVVIFLLPIIAARAISILLSAASTAPDALRWCGAGLLTSGVLLLMLKPKISCFIGVCRTCKHPVPIVFVEFGSCPRCDETLLEKIETSAR
jgi:succinate dehydrogenase/fumarate reductase cytochrome b subunit